MSSLCCVCSWIGCGCEENKQPPLADIKKAGERHCTDLIFFLAYVAGWVAIVAIFISASEDGGDPDR